MANFYCKWCGRKYSSISSLTSGYCNNNPSKKHELYEGTEKKDYFCRLCGRKYSSISSLTSGHCNNSPNKKHQPAL